MKKTVAIIAIIASVAVLAVAGWFGIRWLACARARPHASDGCMSHLSQIGKLFQMYAIDHDGKYPDSWQETHDYLASWSEYSGAKIFVCGYCRYRAKSTCRVPPSLATVSHPCWQSYLELRNSRRNDR